MTRVCILTDSTAQFTRPDFPGHERVFIIPLGLTPGGVEVSKPPRQLMPPTPQDFIRFYSHLGREYDAVLVLTLASRLHATTANAEKAHSLYSNHNNIQVIDTKTIAIGLGLLVETAAAAAVTGATLADIEKLVRAAINRIYMLLCIPELTRLENLGLLTHAQAVVGEILGMLPIFMLEEGSLTPMEKARTSRHLFESFQEFIGEFTAPKHIALLRGAGQATLRTRPMRQYIQETFPNTTYSEHALNQHMLELIGSQSIGLVVMDPV